MAGSDVLEWIQQARQLLKESHQKGRVISDGGLGGSPSLDLAAIGQPQGITRNGHDGLERAQTMGQKAQVVTFESWQEGSFEQLKILAGEHLGDSVSGHGLSHPGLEPESTGVALLQTPVHPLDLAIGKGQPEELKFLIADLGKFLGNPHHGAVVLADQPGACWSLRAGILDEISHIALGATQVGEPLKPILQRSAADLTSIAPGFLLSLLIHQVGDGGRRQCGGHGVQETQSKSFTGISELLLTPRGQSPMIGGAPGPRGGGTGLNEVLHLQAAEMATHGLHRDAKGISELSGGGFSLSQ